MAVELVLCCLVEHTVPSPANGHTPDDLKRNAETVGVFHHRQKTQLFKKSDWSPVNNCAVCIFCWLWFSSPASVEPLCLFYQSSSFIKLSFSASSIIGNGHMCALEVDVVIIIIIFIIKRNKFTGTVQSDSNQPLFKEPVVTVQRLSAVSCWTDSKISHQSTFVTCATEGQTPLLH